MKEFIVRLKCSHPFVNIPPQEDEFLIIDFIAANSTDDWKMTRMMASRKLESLIELGKVTKRKGVYNGSSVNVYRFKE